MSIPADSFTVVPEISPFIAPYNTRYKPLEAVSLGGLALNDASLPRNFQTWKVKYTDPTIEVSTLTGPVVFSYTQSGIEQISLAFDNNMAIVLAWQIGTSSSIYYFDTLAAAFITKTFSGTTSCRICIDEPRDFYNADSDVILAYTSGGNLYWRQQRDRYDVERLIGPTTKKLRRMAQNTVGRLQFELV